VPEDDMYHAMNMGIGMVLIVSPTEAPAVLKELQQYNDLQTYDIGQVVKGKAEVCFV
jgi:phosphoribosylaminoimidazole (AIR) synthetase